MHHIWDEIDDGSATFVVIGRVRVFDNLVRGPSGPLNGLGLGGHIAHACLGLLEAQNVELVYKFMSGGILQRGPQLALTLRSEFALDVVGKDIKARGGCGHHWGWGRRAWAQMGKRPCVVVAFAMRSAAGCACGRGRTGAGAGYLIIVIVTMHDPAARQNAAGK